MRLVALMRSRTQAGTNDSAAQPPVEKRPELRMIARVAPYLWPKDRVDIKRRVVFALLALLLSKVVAVYTPYLFKQTVDHLSGLGVSDFVLGGVGLSVAYGVARIVGNGFQQLRDVFFAPVAQRAYRVLSLETFRHIHDLSLRFHLERRTGALSRIIERGVRGVEFVLRFLLFSIGPLILELVMIAVVLYLAFDFWYLVVVTGTIAAYVAFTFIVTEWRVKLRKKMVAQDNDLNQKAIDSLLNFETVKYFNAEEREAARYDSALLRYGDAALKSSYSLAFLNFGQSVLMSGGLIVVMMMAALGVQAGSMTVGDFVMVNMYMIQITLPLNFLGTVYREIRQSLVDMGDMFGLLEERSEITDRKDAVPFAPRGGKITFKNVSFGYDNKRDILKNVSFSVPAGTHLAIVGPSGSGKSTIARLLFRFYDVSGGAIEIDDQDIRDITQASLHRAIGVVPQDTVLFNDTIAYNIAYGGDNSLDTAVHEAATSSQIHDFVETLPDGYQTMVGERGLKLSGGEKQRVGIARSLLKNPPILVLDEATSALDTETEQDIQDAFAKAGAGRTVISIAHRLSTIAQADEIIVLEQGEVVERGTHDALLAKGGRYCDLWSMQQKNHN